MKKKIIYRTVSVVLFPFYAMAYVISHVLKVKDRENMPTFNEWFAIE